VILSPKKWYAAVLIILGTAFSGLPATGQHEESSPLPEVDLALKQVTDTIRRARNSAELDSVLEELRRLQDCAIALRPSGSETPQANHKIEAARRFVLRWQEYLFEATSGDLERAHDTLESLSQTDEIGLIPRSEILARIHGPAPSQAATRPAIKELLDRIKTLDDMSAALDTLETWHAEGRGPLGEIQQAITALTPLDRTYREDKAGLPTNLESFLTDARMCPNYVMPLRAQLLALVLPRYLGLPEDWKPKSDEGVHAFLDRIVTDAIAKRNYVLAARAREIQYSMKYNGRETQASQAAVFIAAHNQEEAGQYALAVASYQRALAMGTDVVPPKAIGERLTAIQKEHPAEYQEGMQQFLAPPMPRPFDPYRSPYRPAVKPPNPPVFPVPALSATPLAPPPK
jgi:hypothetical protein